MQDSIQNTLRAYYDFWFSCNALYEKWAKRQGITVNTLFVIYTVNAYQETCNQRLICEKLMLPKQTVNTILEALPRKGIVEKRPTHQINATSVLLLPRQVQTMRDSC